jgi:hypothetical protein
MTIFAVGRRRLKIDIRIERLSDSATTTIEQAYFNRKSRDAALAEREHWENEHLTLTGWIR